MREDVVRTENQVRETARRLAQSVFSERAAEIDRAEEYPWRNIEELRAAGLMGMTLPTDLGGKGYGCAEVVCAIEEIAKVCGVTARIVVEANMGAVGAIMAYGSMAAKARAAAQVIAGDKPAICITEPEAGSDAMSLTTTAERCGDHYVINGAKHWITGGGVSKLHLIFARIRDNGRDFGIGGFVAIRGEDDGIEIGRREPTMGLRGIPETEVRFRDLRAPLDMALSPPGGPGRGFGQLMRAYNAQRIGAATVALGIAQGAYERALDYVRRRTQFGRPIAEFQGLQWMLADMSIQLSAARALIAQAAASGDAGRAGCFPDMQLAAQAKIFAAEMAIKVTNDALQLHGAAGYSRANPLERMVRDARMFAIGGGTAQVLRNQVASAILDRKLPQTRDGYVQPSAIAAE